MEKWETELRLKLPGRLRKKTVRFTFEWAAWMIAYDHVGCEISEFHELPQEVQVNNVCYGAALWGAVKHGKGAKFTRDDIVHGLMKATREENSRIGEAMSYAKQPPWMKVDTDKSEESEAKEEKKN